MNSLSFSAFASALLEAIALQALTRVVLDVKVSSLVAAVEALDCRAAIFVALFLAFSARAVSLLARVTSFWRDFISSQVSSVLAAASMTAQVDTRVALEERVASCVAASDALAWISAIFVALFLAFASSLVVFAARATSLEDLSQ